MYPVTKFQFILRTSYFGTKFAPKNMNEKKNLKINIKFETRKKQCMSVPDFIEFGYLQFLGPNLSKKTL